MNSFNCCVFYFRCIYLFQFKGNYFCSLFFFQASDGWYRRWVLRWRRLGSCGDIKRIDTTLLNDGDNKTVNKEDDKNAERESKPAESENSVNGTISKLTKDKSSSEATDCQIPAENNKKFIKLSDRGKVNPSEEENAETSKKSDVGSELSTPMLNIVDYLPSEIMQNLESDISEKSGRSNADSTYPSANMDSLYYPSSYELLSDCDNDTLFDSIQYGIPANTDAEQLKDLVGFISPSHLQTTSFSSARDTEDSEDFVDSIFR